MSKYLGSITRRSLLASGMFSNLRIASAQSLTGTPPKWTGCRCAW